MNKRVAVSVLVFLLAGAVCWGEYWDVMSDTWVATDGQGRELPGYEECGGPREGKTVGIFYFIWLGVPEHEADQKAVYDNTKLLAEGGVEATAVGPLQHFHWWGEPELGYYKSDDEYVIRRHMAMLSAAGVDVLVMDQTNYWNYERSRGAVFETCEKMRAEGLETPQISLFTHSDPNVLREAYETIYSKGKYKDLWFEWKGKPLHVGTMGEADGEIKEFFTIRRCWAWCAADDFWTWVDHYPQTYAWHGDPNVAEEISVSVSEHPISNIGRSYREGKMPAIDEKTKVSKFADKGLFFEDQWKRALEVDPEFVFVTGWNEWIAMRFEFSDPGWMVPMFTTWATAGMFGEGIKPGYSFFVDSYNKEYSRDIEPMKGGYGDDYYYQMVANIRKYKGVRAIPRAEGYSAVVVDGEFGDWAGVGPEYRDFKFDTAWRNEKGYADENLHVDTTGRNDIVLSKVGVDEGNVYFMAETREELCWSGARNWMLLFIDADGDKSSGWCGYDYAVNLQVVDEKRTTVSRYEGGEWRKAGEVSYRYAGRQVEIALPRGMIGAGRGESMTFDFKWADNIYALDGVEEFSLYGDSAPDRRFNYRFIWDRAVSDGADTAKGAKEE